MYVGLCLVGSCLTCGCEVLAIACEWRVLHNTNSRIWGEEGHLHLLHSFCWCKGSQDIVRCDIRSWNSHDKLQPSSNDSYFNIVGVDNLIQEWWYFMSTAFFELAKVKCNYTMYWPKLWTTEMALYGPFCRLQKAIHSCSVVLYNIMCGI